MIITPKKVHKDTYSVNVSTNPLTEDLGEESGPLRRDGLAAHGAHEVLEHHRGNGVQTGRDCAANHRCTRKIIRVFLMYHLSLFLGKMGLMHVRKVTRFALT